MPETATTVHPCTMNSSNLHPSPTLNPTVQFVKVEKRLQLNGWQGSKNVIGSMQCGCVVHGYMNAPCTGNNFFFL